MQSAVYILITSGKTFSFVRHYAILVSGATGGDYVYQCTLYDKNSNGGCAVKTDYTEFLKDHTPIYFLKTELTEADVISKVQELENKSWLPLFFNCSLERVDNASLVIIPPRLWVIKITFTPGFFANKFLMY